MGQLLTTENLLKAVGITEEEVESWRHDVACVSGIDGPNSDFREPLPPPPPDVTHLNIHVSLKPPPQTVAPNESAESEIPEATWQHLEARWNSIRTLEVSIDSLRLNMGSLEAELEAAAKKTLTLEAKVHGLSSDVVQWDKAKSRLRYVLPQVREFIHRATWAMATAERKRVEEIFESHVRHRIAYPQIDEVMAQFDSLLKDRQVLSAGGTALYQKGKGLLADTQRALTTLQNNAAANAKKKGATGAKGRSF